MYDILMVDQMNEMLDRYQLKDYIVWAGCIQSAHVSCRLPACRSSDLLCDGGRYLMLFCNIDVLFVPACRS